MALPRKKISDLVTVKTDRADPKAFPKMQYIGMADVESATGKIINESFGSQMKAISVKFKSGDILYGRLRPYLNKVVCANFEGLASTEFIILRPKQELNSSYLAWRLRADDFVNYANGLNTGDRPRVKFDQIASFNIECPTITHQEKTIDTIETQFTRLEAAIKSLRIIKGKLQIYRQSVLQFFFNGENLSKITINEISSFIGSGITPKGGKKIYLNEGIAFIRSQNIYPFRFVDTNLAYVTETLHEAMKRTHTKPDDVLLNITGASIGRCAVIPKDLNHANVNQHVCIIRPKENVLSDYLCAYLNLIIPRGLATG